MLTGIDLTDTHLVRHRQWIQFYKNYWKQLTPLERENGTADMNNLRKKKMQKHLFNKHFNPTPLLWSTGMASSTTFVFKI